MLEKSEFSVVLSKMRWTWNLCFGALTLLVALGFWINTAWLPIFGLVLMIPIILFVNLSIAKDQACCTLINHYTVFSLFISSVIMVAINIINTHWLIAWTGKHELSSLQSDIPYVSALIVYPVAALMYGVALLRRTHTEYCRACKEQAGYSLRESLQRNVLHGEAKYQLKLAFALCLAMAVIGWAYYLLYYINVNINGVDKFFFFFIPVAVYVLSLVFIYMRYASMQFKVSISPRHLGSESHTEMRFMVIKDDKIQLMPVIADIDGTVIWDTPANTTIPFTEFVNHQEAIDIFCNLSGTNEFTLKRLFSTSKGMSNVNHYAVFLNENVKTPGLSGECFNLYQVNDMMKTGLVARPFAYELHRVFTITMAWKTYDRQGKRLYPIKNYRPTFRLSDFKDWDVDYTDLHWMSISRNNEDRLFFRLRRFWHNHISGIDLRWGKKRY